MVIVHVSVATSSENLALFKERLQNVVAAACQQKGCVRYEWYQDTVSDHQFTVYGEFESEESFAFYKKSEVVGMIRKEVLPLTVSKPSYKHFRGEVFEQG